MTFQLSTPQGNWLLCRASLYDCYRISTHSSAREPTSIRQKRWWEVRTFNSRLHERADVLHWFRSLRDNISTHGSTKEPTKITVSCVRSLIFQLTVPWGNRHPGKPEWYRALHYFYSLLRKEANDCGILNACPTMLFQLTAPRRSRRDSSKNSGWRMNTISTYGSTGEPTYTSEMFQIETEFQLTAPRGSRHPFPSAESDRGRFNSQLHEGADLFPNRFFTIFNISTLDSAREPTVSAQRIGADTACFNSRSAREPTLLTPFILPLSCCFNSRLRLLVRHICFNSRLLIEGDFTKDDETHDW